MVKQNRMLRRGGHWESHNVGEYGARHGKRDGREVESGKRKGIEVKRYSGRAYLKLAKSSLIRAKLTL